MFFEIKNHKIIWPLKSSIETLAGQYFDEETGLHYNYYRSYSPGIGRYVTADPIGLTGGVNLYTYCYQEPVNNIDPNGLWTFQIGFGLNTGAGIGMTKSSGIAISYSKEKGLQVGGYTTVGVGIHGGATGDIVVDLTVSLNDTVSELSGTSVITGGGVTTPAIGPHVGIGGEWSLPTWGDSLPSFTVSPGLGIGTPAELHTYIAHTWTSDPWIKIGGQDNECP